jgi:transposase-like protein
MEQDWLAAQLAAGRSIEAIARDAGRAPSTVAYWVSKHGLSSSHAARHAARGGIEREELAAMVESGETIRAMAARLGVSYSTVRYWLARHGLSTPRGRRIAASASARAAAAEEAQLECIRHGMALHVRRRQGFRCVACRAEAVSRRRRTVKAILVAEAGGRCVQCGYDRYLGALQFHHIDPSTKSFAIAGDGAARSLERARAEAAKCVLLCANCHAEVEAGVATIARTGPADNLV